MSAQIIALPDGSWAVRSGFDRTLLPVLRSLPGAKWDGSLKVWRVSKDAADIPRLFEVARQHGWTAEGAVLDAARKVAAVQDTGAGAIDARVDADPRLFKYQREGVRWLARQDRALLGDQMGLGKTNQILMSLPAGAPVLVICPASVKLTWALKEIPLWRPDLTNVTVLKGRGSFRWPAAGEVVIINYDILPAHKEEIPDPLPGTVMVCDEIHNCKGGATRRTKAVRRLAQMADRVFGLTGTPLLNRPPELWQLLDTLGLADRAFGHFGRFYYLFQASKSGYGTDWGAPRSEVPELLKRVMLRRARAEVMPDLPPKMNRTIIVNDLKAGLRKKLDKVMDAWRKGEEITGRDMPKRLPSFEEMSDLRAELAAAKIPAMLETVEEYEMQAEPLVVFSAHRAPVDILEKREGWGVITGDQSPEQREETKDAFQAGKLKGIALTIGAGREGITLTRASHMLFVDLAWTPAWNNQASDRICRIGQKSENVLYTTLVANHALDRRLEEILLEKEALATATVTAAEVVERFTLSQNVEIVAGQTPSPAVKSSKKREGKPCPLCKEWRPLLTAGPDSKNPGRKFHSCRPCDWFEWADLPVPSLEQRTAAVMGIARLAGMCDGAIAEDEMGFNGTDTGRGRELARLEREWTDNEVRWAMKILPKYHRQLGADLIAILKKDA